MLHIEYLVNLRTPSHRRDSISMIALAKCKRQTIQTYFYTMLDTLAYIQ